MDAYDRGLLALQRGDIRQARELLEHAERDGRAWLLLGQLASNGHGEPPDAAKAARMYARAVELGSAEAAYNLGALYATGKGVAVDYRAALGWYRRSAELGDAAALRMVGLMYASGQGVPVDLDEAERHWRAAATAGQVQALVDLGQLFDYHRSDPVEATYWYLLAAKEGVDVEGALRGLWHRLQPLADAGHTRARTLCGVVLAFQLGDPAGGVALLTASADEGDAIAQRTLAFLLQHGTGTEPDLDLAVTLFRAAAEAGDLLAAYNLGVLYRSGEGVPIEPTESVRWLRVAAAGGLIEAYPLLGDQLAAVDLDQEALEWYLRGAREGDTGCMFAAASCYRDGIGTDLDLVQSLRWFLAMLNAKKGDGLHEAHKIAPRMSTEEIVEAGRLAGRTLETKTLLDMRG